MIMCHSQITPQVLDNSALHLKHIKAVLGKALRIPALRNLLDVIIRVVRMIGPCFILQHICGLQNELSDRFLL